jgi:hypothetical protein
VILFIIAVYGICLYSLARVIRKSLSHLSKVLGHTMTLEDLKRRLSFHDNGNVVLRKRSMSI